VETPVYAGEAQYVAYSDSSRNGPRITLRLPDREALEHFVGQDGRRVMVAIVLIGDDEHPEPPPAVKEQRAAAARAGAVPSGARPGPLCMLAVQLCEMPAFWEFLAQFHGAPAGKQSAVKAVRDLCGVDSRRQLDSDHRAAALFHGLIRRPFMEWQQREGAA